MIASAPSEAEEGLYKSAAVVTDASPEEESFWRLTKSWRPAAERIGDPAWALKEAAEKEWKTQSLWIPNRDAMCWDETNPLEQIKWTWGKNARCKTHYVNVIKAIRWWQRVNHEGDRPKGYPLEHLVGQSCPDGIASVAEGVTRALETIVSVYADYAQREEAPKLPDHGVPSHDVFARVGGKDFAAFYRHAEKAATLAREALDASDRASSAEKWQKLFGDKFPSSGDDDGGEKAGGPKGPFVVAGAKSQTGDLTPRKYG